MKTSYRKGTENLPLSKIVTSLKAYVVVFNLHDNDEVVLEKEIDYGNIEDRKWLGRITHWAMTNHHSVETMALIDAKPDTIEENK